MIDNLIIGAGTSGITIAKNLKSGKNLVLERSNFDDYPIFYRVPLFIGLIFGNSKYIKTLKFKNKNRFIPFYESNVVGGASEINGCVHAFGAKLKWEEELKNKDLEYSQVLQRYNSLFSYHPTRDQIALKKSFTNIIDKLFFKYLNSLNYRKGDMTFSDNEIYGPISLNSDKFFRSSVKKFVNNFNKRIIKKNVDVYDIEFDENNHVKGVNTSNGFIAAKRVILAAGTIGTNKILLKTKKNFKRNNREDPLSDMIGKNIQDHPNFRIKAYTHERFESLNEINESLFLKIKNFIKHSLGINTFFSSTGASSAVYIDFNGDGLVDTKLQIVQFTEKGRLSSDKSKMQFDINPGFSIAITIIDPKSFGNISLSEEGEITVNPNYFNDTKDVDLAEKAIKFILNFLDSELMKEKIKSIDSNDLLRSDIKKFIEENHYSGYHLVGGCGSKNNEVINSDFSLKGVDGVYICDASCFDTCVSSNTHAPVISLAESFSKDLYEF